MSSVRALSTSARSCSIERVDTVELALRTEEVGEAHTSRLVVEVVVEVEQVRFEQRDLGVLVERGTPPDVDRTLVDVAVRALVPAGVHPVGRETDASRDLHVGGREPEQPTPLIALTHPAAHFERIAEHLVGERDVTAGERPSDRRRTHGFVDAVAAFEQVEWLDVEVGIEADLAEQIDVALAMAAEVEVLAHHDRGGRQAVDEHPLDE